MKKITALPEGARVLSENERNNLSKVAYLTPTNKQSVEKRLHKLDWDWRGKAIAFEDLLLSWIKRGSIARSEMYEALKLEREHIVSCINYERQKERDDLKEKIEHMMLYGNNDARMVGYNEALDKVLELLEEK